VRTIIATCVGLVALSAISVQAAPLPRPKAVPTERTISPPIELAAEGCGYGQRRVDVLPRRHAKSSLRAAVPD